MKQWIGKQSWISWSRPETYLEAVHGITISSVFVALLVCLSDNRTGFLVRSAQVWIQYRNTGVGDNQVLCGVDPHIIRIEWLYRCRQTKVRAEVTRTMLTAHCPDCETWPLPSLICSAVRSWEKDKLEWRCNELTWASNISISGAARPTYVPSSWIGPGWLSPEQVHLDSLCPGRYDSSPS